MSDPSKRPSSIDALDTQRVPVPGLPERPAHHARYVITAMGRVYRDDGRLLRPTAKLKIGFNGGKLSRALPVLVAKAFGQVEMPHGYDAWVTPDGPIDPLTGRLRCSVHDVVLVPHGELIAFGRTGQLPLTQLPILR